MARRTNRLNNKQVTNITEENPNPKGFSFNYYENFNHVTELTTENFLNLKTNIFYLLSINNLDSYIGDQKVKKLRKKDIRGNLNDYITDKFDTSLVYELGTSEEDINNDILVK